MVHNSFMCDTSVYISNVYLDKRNFLCITPCCFSGYIIMVLFIKSTAIELELLRIKGIVINHYCIKDTSIMLLCCRIVVYNTVGVKPMTRDGVKVSMCDLEPTLYKEPFQCYITQKGQTAQRSIVTRCWGC